MVAMVLTIWSISQQQIRNKNDWLCYISPCIYLILYYCVYILNFLVIIIKNLRMLWQRCLFNKGQKRKTWRLNLCIFFCRMNRFSMSTRSEPWPVTPTNTWTTRLQVNIQPVKWHMSPTVYYWIFNFLLMSPILMTFSNTLGITDISHKICLF